ncbi:hypothetical protein AVEN_161452-1 [Araneus ventricosus]|uniref:Uncharacterized protein n=1 Tax=Araneus ventricosus TaxID=182803 RepID=A0A4Y2RUB4_ARAVE|nr:hypothetical protein AVEN_161452-1 [Araneus ventricosus]
MYFTEHGPFTSYLKRFNLRSSDQCSCGETGSPLHFATSCPHTKTWHFTKPSDDNFYTKTWHFTKPSDDNFIKRKIGILHNNQLRIRLNQLIEYLKDHDELINGTSTD